MKELKPLPEIEIGDKLKFFYQKGNINNSTYEVRGILDSDQFVVKRLSYRIFDSYFLQLTYNDGYLKIIKPKT
jgi:hypothetical protein